MEYKSEQEQLHIPCPCRVISLAGALDKCTYTRHRARASSPGQEAETWSHACILPLGVTVPLFFNSHGTDHLASSLLSLGPHPGHPYPT